MSARLKRFQMDRALKAFEEAQQAALEALDDVVEAEMAQLALRFPKRVLRLDSGMGSTSLSISKRSPVDELDEWTWGPHAGRGTYHDWPENVPIPAPGLWDAIIAISDNVTDGKDPGFGTVIYENGKRIKGLS